MGVEGRGESLRVAALCAAWYACSSASNVVGKLVLSEFPFPMTVTVVQLAATALLSPPALAACGVRRAAPVPRRYYWRVLAPLALAKFLTTVCSQVSIWKVPISYAHSEGDDAAVDGGAGVRAVRRAAAGRRVPRAAADRGGRGRGVGHGAALLRAGAGRGARGGRAAVAAAPGQQARAARHGRAPPAPAGRAVAAGAGAVPAAVGVGDGAALAAGAGAALAGGAGALLAADGALAWLQAVLAFSVLSRVSPLGYAVASAAKRAAVVAASLLLLRNPAPPANLAGMALAAAGVLAYNRAKLAARAAPRDRPLLPV